MDGSIALLPNPKLELFPLIRATYSLSYALRVQHVCPPRPAPRPAPRPVQAVTFWLRAKVGTRQGPAACRLFQRSAPSVRLQVELVERLVGPIGVAGDDVTN